MESIYKRDRLYLLNEEVTKSFNTYKYYPSVGIPHDPLSEKDVKIETDNQLLRGKLSLFNYTQMVHDDCNVMQSVNAPLIDEPLIKEKLRQQHDCSIGALVRASEIGTLGRATYDYSDFMYCKHLGKVSNNYLITLRRFASPVGDHINHNFPNYDDSSETAMFNADRYRGQNSAPDIGRMVTWMGVSGNKLEDILKYNMNMAWNQSQAEWQNVNNANSMAGNSFIGNLLNSADPAVGKDILTGFQSGIMSGLVDNGLNRIPGASTVLSGDSGAAYNPSEFAPWNEAHKPYGPVNVINQAYILQGGDKGGLSFKNDITLNFEYELRSYDGVNPRAAMLDLIGNVLAVTHTTGDFWGGGYKCAGAHASNIYTNLPLFQKAGKGELSYENFIDTMADSFTSILSGLTGGKGFTLEGLFNAGQAALNGGIGAFLNRMGRPHKTFLHALLNPNPTGLWHLTIGNPKHPIMSIGNLVVKDVSIQHTGLLGFDDFPSGLKVTVTLDHGKPRSNREIEMMYLNGDARIYFPLSTQYKQVYKDAKQYKTTNIYNTSGSKDDYGTFDEKFNNKNEIAWRKYKRNTGLKPEDTEMTKHFMYAEKKKEGDNKTASKPNNAQNKTNQKSNVAAAKRKK